MVLWAPTYTIYSVYQSACPNTDPPTSPASLYPDADLVLTDSDLTAGDAYENISYVDGMHLGFLLWNTLKIPTTLFEKT